MRLLQIALWGALASLSHAATTTADDGWTLKHEAGRCALRSKCGKESFFGGELPCPDNGLAEDPDDDFRQEIVDLCGAKWADTKVCCTKDQVGDLKSNLGKADQFITSCPACRENFYNLFCTFTCSPDQSLFVNVTNLGPNSAKDKNIVKEIDNLWTTEYGSGFYDSCKEVKFGPANVPAMTFLGGGAKDFQAFLNFLGKKQFGGSPFQINFPRPENDKFPEMKPSGGQAIPCNTSDPDYRCVCTDCGGSCTELPAITNAQSCHVGVLPCLSFAVILTYSVILTLLVVALFGHVYYIKRVKTRNERLRLLQDSAMSDDEDDDHELMFNHHAFSQPSRKYWLNTLCDRLFSSIGRACAKFPGITIGTSLVFVGLLSLGWIRFQVERNPVRLWVAPNSAAFAEKAFFDENFGPFFRAEQAFLVNDTGPVFSYDTLQWWFDVENQVRRIKGIKSGATLEQVCYNPTGEACVVQSVSGYFASSGLSKDNWRSTLTDCLDHPGDQLCLPEFKLPLDPKLITGGYEDHPINAKSMSITWVVRNYLEAQQEEVARAMDFEEGLKGLLQTVQMEAKDRGLRLSFNTEISLEQELNKSTNTDAKIVVVSYVIMFLYASLALGSTTLSARAIMRKPSVALVQSKFSLGIVGILIVLLSVSASVGLFSAAGIKVTLIIAEVIPFLVLAVGVDNIFLIVHEFERVNMTHPDLPVEERVARAVGRMGPSILLSASMETVAFSLGAFVGMPAVRNFAAYAAGAVVINALLQLTMFVSALALNQRRVEAGRTDCVPCVKLVQSINLDMLQPAGEEDGLQRFIRRTYAPALLDRKAKAVILTVFLGLLTAGLALVPTVELGLDQKIAIPSDSYLIPYFTDLANYFDSGPPIYFVTREVNITERKPQQSVCGRFPTCDQFSLSTVVTQESKRSEQSYIASSAANWVDDFFMSLDPDVNPKCCVDEKTGKPCFEGREPPYNRTLHGMPVGEEFVSHLEKWLNRPTDEDCPIGGLAAYHDAVKIDRERDTIHASHFRAAHTALRTQADFINSYAQARRVAHDLSERHPELDIYPYSNFYIFFDQYATIVKLSLTLLGSAIAACFVISALLLGSIRTGLVVAVTVTMTLVDIAGSMAVAGVSLNALTLVNLIICVGIGVEFCAHIARAFQFPSARLLDQAASFARSAGPSTSGTGLGMGISNASGSSKPSGPGLGFLAPGRSAAAASRDARAWAALSQVGASVFSGITVTKLLGVAVLAFTRSKIFEIYYFRVWLALVIFAALHALVLLPVLLSLFGGNGYPTSDEGGGLEEDLRRRRYRDDYQDYEDEDDDY